MTSDKPRRRWFRPRYSLTTLFLLVTVFGCWLGYSLNWIKQRREFLALDNVSHIVATYEDWTFFHGRPVDKRIEQPNAPGILRLLGEEGVAAISVTPNGSAAVVGEQIDCGRLLFPEALVSSTVYPYD